MEGTNPVNKKLAAALSGGAVLVLALSGCSGDDSNEKLDAWAKQVCDARVAPAKKIQAANDSIQKVSSENSKPADVQKADSKAFQDLSDAYGDIADAVEKAGPPPTDDGKTKQQNAVKELDALSTGYADLKKKVDKLDTGDQAAFAKGLEGIATGLTKLSKSGDSAINQLQEGEVGEAMAKQDGCKSASPSPSASKKS
ncbi:small secreted protein [Streptomyces sp. SID5785]|uniref:small secreted protein n=1 Tax=Streptomyces sp. SID5785 TaxID=2690309 RepID=UPI001360DA5A|nr:small secreted protein [Streptomyces sp. SID5785]MZD07195.1 small secreted protein [Streptomyces sp. SID5785]